MSMKPVLNRQSGGGKGAKNKLSNGLSLKTQKRELEKTKIEGNRYANFMIIEKDILQEGKYIGYLVIFEVLNNNGKIKYMYLDEIKIQKEYRNKGYGTNILKSLAKEYKGLYLAADNNKAANLYKKLGKKVTEKELPFEINSLALSFPDNAFFIPSN